MKRHQNNICKIVTESKASELCTENFVFEKNNTLNGVVRYCKDCSMFLASSGEARLEVDGRESVISSGTLFFVFPGEKYSLFGKDGFEYIYITFRGTRTDELFERFGISTVSRIFRGFELLLPFWQNALGRAGAKNLDLISESVLLYTFSQMSECDKSSEQHLTGSIISHIETYFSDSSLTLESTASAIGYNPKYISRIFSKNVGITFSEYLKNTRVKHAVFLMENGVTTVKNVALLSGYSDPLYFSNVFKSTVGMSPSEYISKIQSGEGK